MEEKYRGVSITVQPGGLRTNEPGWFTLTWPGHESERIQSTYKQAPYILAQAKEFVDTWMEDGYITADETSPNQRSSSG